MNILTTVDFNTYLDNASDNHTSQFLAQFGLLRQCRIKTSTKMPIALILWSVQPVQPQLAAHTRTVKYHTSENQLHLPKVVAESKMWNQKYGMTLIGRGDKPRDRWLSADYHTSLSIMNPLCPIAFNERCPDILSDHPKV